MAGHLLQFSTLLVASIFYATRVAVRHTHSTIPRICGIYNEEINSTPFDNDAVGFRWESENNEKVNRTADGLI